MSHTRFTSPHTDYLNEITYNFNSTLLGCASADHSISIWSRSENQEEWNLFQILSKFHNGPIHSLSFTHPSFGTLLASSSSDRSVCIYSISENRFLTRLNENDSITSVQFSPPHLGLKLAFASLSGNVRIYENRDVINPNEWNLVDTISTSNEKLATSNLSWCSNPTFQLLAVSGDSLLQIYSYTSKSKTSWQNVVSFNGHSNYIHSIEFSPSIGKTFELLATGCADQKVRLFKIFQNVIESKNKIENGWQIICISSFSHDSIVWKVSFNLTGSMLASISDVTKIYTSTVEQQWKLIKTFDDENEEDWMSEENSR